MRNNSNTTQNIAERLIDSLLPLIDSFINSLSGRLRVPCHSSFIQTSGVRSKLDCSSKKRTRESNGERSSRGNIIVTWTLCIWHAQNLDRTFRDLIALFSTSLGVDDFFHVVMSE